MQQLVEIKVLIEQMSITGSEYRSILIFLQRCHILNMHFSAPAEEGTFIVRNLLDHQNPLVAEIFIGQPVKFERFESRTQNIHINLLQYDKNGHQ